MINKIKAEIEKTRKGRAGSYTRGMVTAYQDCLKLAEQTRDKLKDKVKNGIYVGETAERLSDEFLENIEEAFEGLEVGE